MSKLITKWLQQKWQQRMLTLMTSAVIMSGAANAQVLINEDFSTANAVTPPTGWTNVANGTTVDLWHFDNPGLRTVTGGTPGFNGNFAIFDSDNYLTTTGEDGTLTTPDFDASIGGNYTLEFDNQVRYISGQICEVDVWNGTAWVNAAAYNTANVGYTNPAAHSTIDISGLTGGSTTCKVRFHFVGNDRWWWAIDNVKITRVTCSTPTAATTIASANNLCLGATTNLSLSATTPGAGYQWQSSPDNTAYTDIAGATGTTYVATPASSTYYRCKITCSGGPTTINSTPVQVTFLNTAPVTTPGSRCGTGSVNLAATGSGTLSWYTTATGGAALGSGTPFATPIISSTTTFYVGSENIAPGSVTIGAGATTSTTYPSPFYSLWSNTHNQYLIRATELQAQGLNAGNITSMAFTITSGTLAMKDFSVKMANTTATDVTAFLAPTFTTVYTSVTQTPVIGLNTLTFSAPFNWDGASNIVIEVCHGNSASSATMNSTAVVDNTAYVSTIHTHKSAASAGAITCTDLTTNKSTYSIRPRFVFTGQTVCSSPRTPAVATISAPPALTITGNQTVCNNEIKKLEVTSTIGNFNNYIWTPSTNLYTDAAATIAYTGTSASTVYYKSATAGTTAYTLNANNTVNFCANVANVSVTALPATATVLATPSYHCQTGTSMLTLTPGTGYGAGVTQWQSSANDASFADIVGSTGSTYTTPILSSTMYYRVTVKNGAGTTCFSTLSDTGMVYSPVVTGTTPAARCGNGTLTLGATGTGGTLNWYTTATGGTSIATGGSYTTPSLSATTTYYVATYATGGVFTGTIGNGAYTSNSTAAANYSGASPFAYWYGNYKHQMLVTASELISAGLSAGKINSVALDVVSIGASSTFNNFNISIYPTALAAMGTNFVTTGGTTVYTAASAAPVVGVNTFNFSTPFTWDGTSNIVVQMCWNNNNTGILASSAEVKYDTTAYMSHTIYRADNALPNICSELVGNAVNDGPFTAARPKMIFTVNSLCESARTTVAATVNPQPSVNATGSTLACYNGTDGTATAVGSSGTTPYGYSWNTTPVQNVANATNLPAGNYTVILTDAKNCTATANATVTNAPTSTWPAIGTQPVARTICENGNTTFSVAATGLNPTYRWEVKIGAAAFVTVNNGGVYSGATTNILAITNAPTTLNTNQYRCVVSGTCVPPGSAVTSNAVSLTVNANVIPTISTSASTTAICTGETVNFTSNATNTGTTPVYTWRINGIAQSGNSPTFSYSSFNNNDNVTLDMTSNAICPTPPMVSSIGIIMTVRPFLNPTINITASPGVAFCAGQPTTFTANITGGGTSPSYEWRRNGIVEGPNSATYLPPILNDGDLVTCRLTSNYPCLLSNNPVSNTLTMNVAPVTTPGVTIAVSPNDSICTGASVTFTATSVNEGAAPLYEWRKNGTAIPGAGTASIYTTSNISNGDVITCQLLSNKPCVNPTTALSNGIMITVSPILVPSVSITATPDTSICTGTLATFNAYPVNGGVNPAYQWRVNGQAMANATASVYSLTNVNNGDVISCDMSTKYQCPTVQTVVSNSFSMEVGLSSPPIIAISVSPDNKFIQGQEITFKATAVNAGSLPTYKWRRNGEEIAGASSSTYKTTGLSNDDKITSVVFSSSVCSNPDSTVSNSITMVDVTGVEEIEGILNDVALYPNPNQGVFVIESERSGISGTSVSFEILNNVGQLIERGEISVKGGSFRHQISLQHLSSGTYFIKVSGDDKQVIKRFNIQQ